MTKWDAFAQIKIRVDNPARHATHVTFTTACNEFGSAGSYIQDLTLVVTSSPVAAFTDIDLL